MDKSRIWPVGITVVYILFFIVVIGTVIFTRFERVDLVESNYYEKGLAYQSQVNRQKNTSMLNPDQKPKLSIENSRLILKMARQSDVDRIRGRIVLFRPSDAKADLNLALDLNADNTQIVDIRTLMKGLWRVKIFWMIEDREYYDEQTVIVE